MIRGTHKSTAHYTSTGIAPAPVRLSKEEKAKIQAATDRLGVSLRRRDLTLTRAEREAQSRARQIHYAKLRETKAQVH